MNNTMLAGRTVYVSDELKEGKNTVTYVRLAVKGMKKDKDGKKIDDFFDLKFYNGQSTFAQKFLNILDPAKVKAKVKNPIYSRTIAVSGRISTWTEHKQINIKYQDLKLKPIEYYLNHFNIVVNTYTLLDAMPEFAKKDLANDTEEVELELELEEEVVEVKTKSKSKKQKKSKAPKAEDIVVETSTVSSGTMIDDEDIPM